METPRTTVPLCSTIAITWRNALYMTSRSGQEYHDPLLCIEGEAYAQLSIEALYAEVLRAIRPHTR